VSNPTNPLCEALEIRDSGFVVCWQQQLLEQHRRPDIPDKQTTDYSITSQ